MDVIEVKPLDRAWSRGFFDVQYGNRLCMIDYISEAIIGENNHKRKRQ